MKTQFQILEITQISRITADSTDEIFARVVTIAAPNTCNPATTSFKLLSKN